MKAWKIKDWQKTFDRYHKDTEVVFRWIAVPTKHDGRGLKRIGKHPDGAVAFCAWILMVEVAAKMPVRGILADDDGPLTSEDLADKTGFPQTVFDTGFAVLSLPQIGWLVRTSLDSSRQLLPTEQDSTEQERTEQEDCNEPASGQSLPPSPDPALPLEFPWFDTTKGKKTGAQTWLLTEDFMRNLAEAFPAVDVPAECRKAWIWVKANRSHRKTAGGMPDFLRRWVAKEQDRGSARRGSSGYSRQSTPDYQDPEYVPPPLTNDQKLAIRGAV